VDGKQDNAIVSVRYHDHTVEFVEVLDERAGHYLRVHARDVDYTKDLSRFIHRLIGSKLQKKYGNKWGDADRREAREQILELVNEARRRHKRNQRALANNPLFADESTYREIAKSPSGRQQLASPIEPDNTHVPTPEVLAVPDEELFVLPQLAVPHLSTPSTLGVIQ